MSSKDFTASSSFSEDLVPSKGRLNGPLAWCSSGDTAGDEFLQIHIPEAESICAIATQGNGYGESDYITEYNVKHSEDGSLWKEIEDESGKMKVFCLTCLLLVSQSTSTGVGLKRTHTRYTLRKEKGMMSPVHSITSSCILIFSL